MPDQEANPKYRNTRGKGGEARKPADIHEDFMKAEHRNEEYLV
jgi:hypothetical protein